MTGEPLIRTAGDGRRRGLRGMDGLRAIACLTVFLANLHHSMGVPVAGRLGPLDLEHFAESGVGVALFLVLSGALLSLPYWRDLMTGDPHPTWKTFARRRVFRIVPPFYACLVALFVWRGFDDMTGADWAVYFLFVNNWREGTFYGLSPQFWTIGMFVQLYFLVPVLFVVLRRVPSRRRGAPALVAASAFGAYAVHAILMASRDLWLKGPLLAVFEPDGFVLSHSPLAHLPIFLLGIAAGGLLAKAHRGDGATRAGARAEAIFWTAAAGLVVLSAAPAADRLLLPYGRYWFPWMPTLLASMIVTVPAARFAGWLLESAPLRGLGVISYGVYIYHMAVMQAVRKLPAFAPTDTSSGRWQFAAVSLGLTVVIAACSYWLLERPLLQRLARRSGPS